MVWFISTWIHWLISSRKNERKVLVSKTPTTIPVSPRFTTFLGDIRLRDNYLKGYIMNRSQYTLQVHLPEECAKCKSKKIRSTSEYDTEYFRHWVRMICEDCNHQWSELYQLDS